MTPCCRHENVVHGSIVTCVWGKFSGVEHAQHPCPGQPTSATSPQHHWCQYISQTLYSLHKWGGLCLLKSHRVLKESPTSGEFACVSLGDSFCTPWLFNPHAPSTRVQTTAVSLVNCCGCTPPRSDPLVDIHSSLKECKYCCSNTVCSRVQHQRSSLTANTCSKIWLVYRHSCRECKNLSSLTRPYFSVIVQ